MKNTKSHIMRVETSVVVRDAMGNIKLKKILPPNVLGEKLPQNTIDVTIRTKNGIIVKEYKDIPMNSYVGNALGVIGRMFNIGTYGTQVSMTNSANTVSNWTFADSTYAGVGKNQGILVGTDTTSVDVAQYTLAGLIAHGNSAGRLYYNANSYGGLSRVGNNFKHVISRTFSNNSGGTINIRECSLGTFSNGLPGTLAQTCMVARDILNYQGNPINISLADGQTAQFTYNMYYSFSDGFVDGWSKVLASQLRSTGGDANPVLDLEGDTITTYNIGSTSYYINCAIGENFGFLVGSGDTAPTMDDYQLATMITHGTGAGQLSHQALDNIDTKSTTGQVTSFRIGRTFTNGSGGDVTVREMGMAFRHTASTNRVLFMRKLTGNLVIPDAGALQVQQRFATTSHD